jgi:hypothetical protein
MTRRLATMCLMMMFSTGIGSPPFQAQETGAGRTTLKGLSAIYVVVEQLSESARSLGIEARSIQSDVELRLVQAGMNVVPQEEGKQLPGRPFLYIRITVTKSAEAAYVGVELDQDAQLERNNQRALSVATWDTGTISAHPSDLLIREAVKGDVDKFLNAWLSVNSRK